MTPADWGAGPGAGARSNILHIGLGAFHRAHQAVYTEDAQAAAQADGRKEWRIQGISMRSTHSVDALNQQGGRYTLVTRGEDGTSYRQINVITAGCAVVRGLAPVLAALTQPSTSIVSLTITEKGYGVPPPDAAPQTHVLALLTAALAHRKRAGLPPFTLLSCDNLSDNGALLRRRLVSLADQQDPALASWIAEKGAFPATMVDRITPATTPSLIEEVARETGFQDAIPVETESFSQWVIEDRFLAGRPEWERAGALLVSSVAPFEQMKLRLLNGAHSMLAYMGHLTAKRYVRDVMSDPVQAAFVERYMTAAAKTLQEPAGFNLGAYQTLLLRRFRNPYIAHETYQIAMDGSQKMPQRIFVTALDALERGLDVAPFALAIAAWLRYLEGRDEDGQIYALRDPREAELARLPAEPVDRVKALLALPELAPPALAADGAFVDQISQILQQIRTSGMAVALSTLLDGA